MDDTDRHLLSLLQANARAPAAELARKLKVARTTVVARIARLEREGVIAGYGVRLGQRLEQAAVRAYCGLSVAPKMAAGVIRALRARARGIRYAAALREPVEHLRVERVDLPARVADVPRVERARQPVPTVRAMPSA